MGGRARTRSRGGAMSRRTGGGGASGRREARGGAAGVDPRANGVSRFGESPNFDPHCAHAGLSSQTPGV